MKRFLTILIALIAMLPARSAEEYAFMVDVEQHKPMRVVFSVDDDMVIFSCEEISIMYFETLIMYFLPNISYSPEDRAIIMEEDDLYNEPGHYDADGNRIINHRVVLYDECILVGPEADGSMIEINVVPEHRKGIKVLHDTLMSRFHLVLPDNAGQTQQKNPAPEPDQKTQKVIPAKAFELNIASLLDHRFGMVPLDMPAAEVKKTLDSMGYTALVGKRPQGESHLDPRMVLQFDQYKNNPKREFWMINSDVVVSGFNGGSPLPCILYLQECEKPSRWSDCTVSFSFYYRSKASVKTEKQRAEALFRYVTDTFKAKGVPLKGNGKKQSANGCLVKLEHNKDLSRYYVDVHLKRSNAPSWPIPTDIWRY